MDRVRVGQADRPGELVREPGLDGVGYRGLGNLRDVGLQPPADWWTRSEVWTWRRIRSTYPFRRQAWLKVRACKESKL